MSGRMIQVLSIGLSTLGGFVDAMGHLALGGVFVSFMSGNSTLLGVAGAEGVERRVWLTGGLVVAFTVGVMLGTWVGRPFGARRAPVVLVAVAGLLLAAALLHAGGLTVAAGVVVALAMGTENTTFQKDGQAGMGLTYMTGTLVRLGQRLAEAVAGGPWAAAVPDVLLWGGMVVGASLGAEVFGVMGLHGLWLAVAVVLGLAVMAQVGLRPAELPVTGKG